MKIKHIAFGSIGFLIDNAPDKNYCPLIKRAIKTKAKFMLVRHNMEELKNKAEGINGDCEFF